jgi:hypothetical protein
MIYQIVINITNKVDSYSNKNINSIFLKYIENTTTLEEAIYLRKVLCYSILLFKTSTDIINLNFIGKIISIDSEIIDNVIIKYKLDVQSIKSIDSNKNYVMPCLFGGLGNRLFQFFTILNFANKNGKKCVINISPDNIHSNPHSKTNYEYTIFKNIQKKFLMKKQIMFMKKKNLCIMI